MTPIINILLKMRNAAKRLADLITAFCIKRDESYGLTLNQRRELHGLKRISDPDFDKRYVVVHNVIEKECGDG